MAIGVNFRLTFVWVAGQKLLNNRIKRFLLSRTIAPYPGFTMSVFFLPPEVYLPLLVPTTRAPGLDRTLACVQHVVPFGLDIGWRSLYNSYSTTQ